MKAPVTFQRPINLRLSMVKWAFALVYMDDVFIFSRSVGEHCTLLKAVLRLLLQAVVTLKLN